MSFSLLIQKDDPSLSIRLSPLVLDKIQMSAKKAHRKVQTEIIYRLVRTYTFDKIYQLIAPLVRFDLLSNQNHGLLTKHALKATVLQKNIDRQLNDLQAYFKTKKGFTEFKLTFPKDLWRALQMEILQTERSIEEVIMVRLVATFKEARVFQLPEG